MKKVHDKAPVRKKEDKRRLQEEQRKYHGPKTGPHGEHNVVDKEGGGWICNRCEKFSTTYLGWKRLVRTPRKTKTKNIPHQVEGGFPPQEVATTGGEEGGEGSPLG
eukprot:7394088-Heterocapsa_arctica.AAC.1